MDTQTNTSHKSLIITIVVVVLLALAGAYIYYNGLPSLKSAPKVAMDEKHQDPEKALADLKVGGKTQTVSITDEANLDIKDDSLPTSLKYLVTGEPKEASNATFADGKTGYKFTFRVYSGIEESYRDVRNKTIKGSYTFLEGSYNEDASVMFLTDSQYSYELNFFRVDDTTTDITIIAKAK